MESRGRTFFIIVFCLFANQAKSQEFTCKTLDGEQLTINEWPIFLINSHSKENLNDTLRCASLVSTLESPHWLINFAWPGSERAKRMSANVLLKSGFMKKHSTVLENSSPDSPLISLVDSEFQILWCSYSYPNKEEWNQAVKSFHSARTP